MKSVFCHALVAVSTSWQPIAANTQGCWSAMVNSAERYVSPVRWRQVQPGTR